MMDINQNKYNSNEIIFLANKKFLIPPNIKSKYQCFNLENYLYQRLLGKIFSTYIPTFRLLILLLILYIRDIKIFLNCSWMFEEAEFISSWGNCIKHFYLEDGQLGQVEIKPYPNNKKMTWKFRKKFFKENRFKLSFREDCSGYLCITEQAYKSHSNIPKRIYGDFRNCLNWYSPRLLDINKIVICPHPKRLPEDKYLDSVLNQCLKLDSRWALKLHWGVYSYKKLYKEICSIFAKIDPSIGILCDEYTIIELEMFIKEKQLFGNFTSLALYAQKFGSQFNEINFEGFIGFKNGEKFFMPK